MGKSVGFAWQLAFMIAFPFAQLYVLFIVIAALVSGDIFSAIIYLLFGWIFAAITALIIAIPLGVVFTGFAVTYRAGRMWWDALPFTWKN